MKISLIHLTDLHFTVKTASSDKVNALCAAIITQIRNSDACYVISSGDIAYSGSPEEFEVAKKFYSIIKQLVRNALPAVQLDFLFTPGNHDCFLKNETQLRKALLQNVSYQSLGSDSSIINQCIQVQDAFWDFYKNYQELPKNKLLYQVIKTHGNKKIVFNLMNTAWMSQIEEKPGSMFYPVNLVAGGIREKGNYNIGIWHHPYNWFTPNTAENNKKEFESFTESMNGLHFFGHEHEFENVFLQNHKTGNKSNLLSGSIFHDDSKPKKSGFQTVSIDLETEQTTHTTFEFKEGSYVPEVQPPINMINTSSRKLLVNKAFKSGLEEIKIPFVIEGRTNIKQSEIFVYQDLDNPEVDSMSLENYFNSIKLAQKDSLYSYAVIDGESQSGKSTLAAMLHLTTYENGLYPVSIKGSEIKEVDVLKLVRRKFRVQYDAKDTDFHIYNELNASEKILIIDDFHECNFNVKSLKAFFEAAKNIFGRIIYFITSESLIIPSIRAEFVDVTFFRIKQLGFVKRNELIEKYQWLKEDNLTAQEGELHEKIKIAFDNVQSVLGDKLIPSFPVYIISILQALEYKPLSQNETSYGYCYQTLIHYSLHKSGISNDDLDTYINFITELAYSFLIHKIYRISPEKFSQFHQEYQQKYLVPRFETVKKNLLKSKIIQEVDGDLKFGYNYILYFLAAKKISDIIHTAEGKQIINDLFKEMHLERNASVLVLITHHSKDITFIEESVINSMMILESINPITLEQNDPFYQEIYELAEGIKDDILISDNSPKEERAKMLSVQDHRQHIHQTAEMDTATTESEEALKFILPFKTAFRSIEIVGQIIKNRKGSLPKNQLMSMIQELYTTGFRTINYSVNLFANAKEGIIEQIRTDVKDDHNKAEIEAKVLKFFKVMCLEMCFNVFGKVTHAVGNKDLRVIFGDVSRSMGTPAAKILTFGINSYYGTITPEELRELTDQFKDNIVALALLRGRVKHYVYNREVTYKTKQQFASILKMQLAPVNPSKRK